MFTFILIIALVLFVVHQATKKSPEFLQKEKLQMEEKVNSIKKEIASWKYDSLKEITNDIEYSYVKSMSSVLTGVIKTSDHLPIVAFQRIDRGIFVNSRILASTTDFKIYCEFKKEEKLFFFNDVYLGKIVNFEILDAADNKIGKCTRNNSIEQKSFKVEFRFGAVAEINKNEDRKAFISKYRFRSLKGDDRFQSKLEYREPQPPIRLLKSINTTDEEELKWIISLTICEAVYYGFSFVS